MWRKRSKESKYSKESKRRNPGGKGEKMKRILFLMFVLVLAASCYAAEADYWVAPMTEVHKNFTGEKGTIILPGDSITEYLAFWTPVSLGVKNCPENIDLDKVIKYVKPEAWKLKGEKYGNLKGWTVTQAGRKSAMRLLNPEVAIILLGTNDARTGGPEKTKYEEKMLKIIDGYLKNGTIVLLTTLPPMKGKDNEIAEYNKVVHKMAEDRKLPLIEYYEEWIKLTGIENWSSLSADGVHPTAASRENWSKEGLLKSGYSLRNYLTVEKYYEVLTKILSK